VGELRGDRQDHPYKLWEEIVEHKNVALGIVVAGMFIAIGQIVAAAIHG
jgi:uncharacterized membrane protein YjfL (UPF0719 family)